MIAHDELIEYAHVYGDYKGIPRQQIEHAIASGKISSCAYVRVLNGCALYSRSCVDLFAS